VADHLAEAGAGVDAGGIAGIAAEVVDPLPRRSRGPCSIHRRQTASTFAGSPFQPLPVLEAGSSRPGRARDRGGNAETECSGFSKARATRCGRAAPSAFIRYRILSGWAAAGLPDPRSAKGKSELHSVDPICAYCSR